MCNIKDTKYRTGSFTDNNGRTCRLTVCAVVTDPDEGALSIASGPDSYGRVSALETGFEDTCIRRVVYIGYSLCGPQDTYDAELEKQMAYDNATDNDQPSMAVCTAYPQLLSENVIQALLDQEYARIVSNPDWLTGESSRKGYDSLTDKQKRFVDMLLDCSATEIMGLMDMAVSRRLEKEKALKKRRGKPRKNG